MYSSLTRPEDFRRVYRDGQLKFGRFLAVHVLSVPDQEVKIGLSVSKKVGKAVIRNLVRRRLREIIRGIDLEPGYHIIVGAKVRSREASFLELKTDLFRIMQGLGMIKEN